MEEYEKTKVIFVVTFMLIKISKISKLLGNWPRNSTAKNGTKIMYVKRKKTTMTILKMIL